MKKFTFRLEALLNYRLANQGKLQKQLCLHDRNLAEIEVEIRELEQEIIHLEEDMRKKRENHERDFEQIYAQILDQLKTNFKEKLSVMEGYKKTKELLKENVKRAYIERKVIEKIKQKQYSLARIQHEKEQDRQLDEISSRTS